MTTLDERQVEDLLFGDTDPRQVALFLAQQGPSMDPVERDQRLTILRVLEVMASRQVADQTADLAKQTGRMAAWTSAMAITTGLLAFATVAINLFD